MRLFYYLDIFPEVPSLRYHTFIKKGAAFLFRELTQGLELLVSTYNTEQINKVIINSKDTSYVRKEMSSLNITYLDSRVYVIIII